MERVLQRHGLLQHMSATGPLDRGDIQTFLAVSRSTTHRIIHRFTDLGLIERTDGGYRLTPFGHVVAEETARCVDTIDVAQRIEPLIEVVEACECPFDVGSFTNVNVTEPDARNPAKVEDRLLEIADGATTVRLALDIVRTKRYVESFYDGLDESFTGTLVSSLDAAEAFVYAGMGAERTRPDSRSLEVRLIDGLPLYLALIDDHACVGVYNEERTQISLLVDSVDDATVAWAETCFENLAERADPDPLDRLRSD